MKKLQELNAKISEIESKSLLANDVITFKIDPRDNTSVQRIIVPGQILRFPTQDEWDAFTSVYSIDSGAYDILTYRDPLGFDGGAGKVYSDGSNPDNYLRRNQLPNMQIDMTNIYQPQISGKAAADSDNNYFTPFLAQRNGKSIPEILSVDNTIFARPPGELTSSLAPYPFTCKEAREFANEMSIQSGTIPYFVVEGNFQSIQRSAKHAKDVFLNVILSDNIDLSIGQVSDCSAPSVGCFWFNDGKDGQIELPKDPSCRVGVIVRFKKFVLL